MSDTHPSSAGYVRQWAMAHGLPIGAARRRYAQYVVAKTIASHRIGRQIVFKGGNALRLVYSNPRGTIDLDFTAKDSVPDSADWLKNEIESAIAAVPPNRTDYKLKLQSVKREPGSPNSTFPTYQLSIGFALLGDKRYADFEKFDRPLSDTIPIEISINDKVCKDHIRRIGSDTDILVCTLDDIVAEKLRSLLQQPIRNRHRRQDVFDIARISTDQSDKISVALIAVYLHEKCAARDIAVSKSAFNDEVEARARYEYERLRDDTGDAFIPFDTAWPRVMDLVQLLDIPDL